MTRFPNPALRPGLLRLSAGLLMIALLSAPGCSWVAKMGSDRRGESVGKTFYLGGAGPFGHVGSFDVPEGLRTGGYRGAIEVFPWQSWIGWTIRDQIDRYRNDAQGRKLAALIREYLDEHPDRPVNIIALSAGTGVATWALEHLPPPYRVNHVVFFASSLSRRYDLSEALRRIRGRLYSFYSTADPILKYAVPLAGSVDREMGSNSVGGLTGFVPPRMANDEVTTLYKDRVRNLPWRQTYSRYGYDGNHTDATSVEFIQRVVVPLLTKPPVSEPARSAPEPEPARPPNEPDPADKPAPATAPAVSAPAATTRPTPPTP